MRTIGLLVALPPTMKVLVLAGLLLGSASESRCESDLSVPVVAGTSQGRTVLADDAELSRKRGLLFYRGDLFTGLVEQFDADGVLRTRNQYEMGRRHGDCRRWYSDGTLESVREYRENRKHGQHAGWFEKGQKKFLMHFDRGSYIGERKEWYASGKPFALFQYEFGKEVGLQRVWGPSGNLRSNYVVRNGRRYGLIGAKPCVSVPELPEILANENEKGINLGGALESKKEPIQIR
jgi:hypothetical protein